MADHQVSNDPAAKARRSGSHSAIIEAAEHLFLEKGFGAVSMDDLAEAAGVARRTLYNQFASKEELFRETLLGVSRQFEAILPPGIETQGEVEDVLRLIAKAITTLHERSSYLGFFRIAVADSRQFPWIAEAFAAVIDPLTDRFARYLAHLTSMGVLDCRNPLLAAHQFTGILNQFVLWPWMLGRVTIPVALEEVVEETIRMFLGQYRRAPVKGRR